MARIKLIMPQKKLFTTSIDLTINFVNYGGHMGNDAVLTLCQEARIRFLKSHNYTELDFHGKSLIQADAAIVFKSECFHGDNLTIELFSDDLSQTGFDLYYLISLSDSKREIARAKTGMVFFDYNERKVSRFPDILSSELA